MRNGRRPDEGRQTRGDSVIRGAHCSISGVPAGLDVESVVLTKATSRLEDGGLLSSVLSPYSYIFTGALYRR